MKRLEGKSILVIGGTSGLGLSAARKCAEEGARLVIVGRDDSFLPAAQREFGSEFGRDCVQVGDAANPAVAVRAVETAVANFGRLDAAYHVAGGSGRRMGDGPLDKITDEGWQGTLNSNLTSLFNTNRAAARQFLAQKTGGAILNISSVLAFSPSPAHFATHAYAAAKAAVIGFTRSCAAYYAPHQIRFNVIAPALVETPMSQRAADDDRIQKFIAAKQPLDGGRIGIPSDLDGAVVYFLSDESKFVTGQVLAVDGGWTVTEGEGNP